MNLRSPDKKTPDLGGEFRSLAEEVARYAAAAGVEIKPYFDATLPHFSSLRPAKKAACIASLTYQRDFFATAESEKLPLESVQLIWRTLAKMKMRPQSDIFDKITSEDTVEVYNSDGMSCFKNLVFFRFISMSLEEIYSLPWYEQMTASPQLIAYFMELATRVKITGIGQTFSPRFSHYTFHEKRGEKRHVSIHLKWISPVTYEGKNDALLFVNRSQLVAAK